MSEQKKILQSLEIRLNAKTIHELRQVAREVGVKCPAAGKKDRLVKDCLNIASGAVKPAPKKTDGGIVGAPPKSREFDRQLVSDILACRDAKNVRAEEAEPRRYMTVSSGEASLLDFTAEGILEKCGERWFLRTDAGDIFVHEKLIVRYGLREGDIVGGRSVRGSVEEIAGLAAVFAVNGAQPDGAENRRSFDALTPVYPAKRLIIARGKDDIVGRMIDLFAPVGAGQRAFVCGAHGSGKTELLKSIAAGIKFNNPEVRLIIALTDARPEEAADYKRTFTDARVFASTLESDENGHIRTARLALEHAKRQTESGADAVIILDDLTRLTRSYNCCGGQVYSALDTSALDGAKRFVAAARSAEEGGSLTIIAALGSGRGDALEETAYSGLKDACNMRITLSYELKRARVNPPIDLADTYAADEERLLTAEECGAAARLRGRDCIKLFAQTDSNGELCSRVNGENYGG